MRFGVKSDKGMVREINEDSYKIISGYPGIPSAFIVADGMGGHNSGEIASKLAVDFISNYILSSPSSFTAEKDIPSAISHMIEKANSSIYNSSMEHANNYGMGTTLTVAVECSGVAAGCGKKLYIGHIGDSRAYVVRHSGIERITTDHSFIEELIKSGSLTREEAENHPKKNIITRALGCVESIESDIYISDIMENDIFIICTDGLTNMLGEDVIKKMAQEFDNPQEACDRMVEAANKNGGNDNITVVVIRI